VKNGIDTLLIDVPRRFGQNFVTSKVPAKKYSGTLGVNQTVPIQRRLGRRRVSRSLAPGNADSEAALLGVTGVVSLRVTLGDA